VKPGGAYLNLCWTWRKKANITPQDTLEGVKTKLNLLDRTGDLMMKWADLADDYKAEHGASIPVSISSCARLSRGPAARAVAKEGSPPASSEAKRPAYQSAPPPGSVPVPTRP